MDDIATMDEARDAFVTGRIDADVFELVVERLMKDGERQRPPLPDCCLGLFLLNGAEVAASDYKRLFIPASSWATDARGDVVNTDKIAFPSTLSHWGTVNRFGLYDATSGALLRWGDLLGGRHSIIRHDRVWFEAGALRLERPPVAV
jgi:hypothetical protein